jgi:hypothetical protein
MNDQIDDRYDVWYGMTIWWTKCFSFISFEWKHYDKIILCTSNVCKLIYMMNLWEL